jgi:hypothetical protein
MEQPQGVTPETVILDIIQRQRGTEAIFRRLEAETGACICCEGLFLTLREAAARFGFSAGDVLAEIRAAVRDDGLQDGRRDASAATADRSVRASPRRASQR